MKVLLLNAHPDVGSFSDALAAAYDGGARAGGHEIKSIALRDLKFDLVLRAGFHNQKSLEPDTIGQQALIQWCEHLVIVSPNWWWAGPTLLKGYVDRVFLLDFAMRYHTRFPYLQSLLKGRSARVIYTRRTHHESSACCSAATCSGAGFPAASSGTAAFALYGDLRCIARWTHLQISGPSSSRRHVRLAAAPPEPWKPE
ncbi:NAD(P)H-dependent oxidoreductase [Xanthobacter sp. VTT E-85241]|uniref:NAD(P)H-dependent oxidoreductase n=1 Tax=Roseixanthobacter finlandensis TaxID=3119922 RepID=UPI0037277EA3